MKIEWITIKIPYWLFITVVLGVGLLALLEDLGVFSGNN